MHALLVRVSIQDREQAEKFLKEQVVPGVSQAPGFVAGYWMNVGGSEGAGVIVFESEDAASRAQDALGGNRPPEEAATITSVELGEVVATA